MRILAVTPWLPPAQGGVARYVEAQCRTFAALGDTVFAWELVAQLPEGTLKRDLVPGDAGEWWRTKVRTGWMLRHRSFRGALGRLRARMEFREIEELFVSHAPDAVLVHYPIESAWPAVALAQHFNVPLVCFLHGDDVALVPLADPRFGAVRSRIIRESTLSIFPSSALRDLAVQMGLVDAEKCRVLPLGVALAEAATPTVEIVHVSNMSDVKRVPMVLRSFAIVLRDVPGAILRLVGTDSASEQELRRLAEELDIADSVQFVRFTSSPNFEMRSSCLLLLASEREGGPLVALEAMAMGIPVVTPAVGILANLTKEAGVWVVGSQDDPDLETKLATACVALLRENDLRKALSLAAIEFVRTHFDRETSVRAQRLAVVQVLEESGFTSQAPQRRQWI